MSSTRVLAVLSLLSCVFPYLNADAGPRFINNPEPLVVPLGDEVELECSLDVPADQVRWLHDGRVLTHPVRNETANSQLIFKLQRESQVGSYQCVAWYGASGLASSPAKLSLAKLEPPPPPTHSELLVTQDNNLVIKCSLSYSNPPAVVQYYRNNEPLQASQIINSDTLLLTNVSTRDSGVYSCSQTNTYVEHDTQFLQSYHSLRVLQRGHQTARTAPVFGGEYRPPSRYNVLAGANITLECVAWGEPVPKVSWRRKDGVLPANRSSVTSAGLRLVNISEHDEGTYVCQYSNGVSPNLLHYIDVVFQEPPVVEKGPENLLVKEGGRAKLECSLQGKPAPTITWLLNGVALTNDTHVTINGPRIQIADTLKSHAGMYQCMAESEVGFAFGASTLRVEPRQVTASAVSGKEGRGGESRGGAGGRGEGRERGRGKMRGNATAMIPPTRPSVTRLTDTSVMVRWHIARDQGLSVMFLKVQHRKQVKGTRWSTNNEDIPPHVNSYEVTDLTPDTWYRFRVAAVYSNMDNKLSPNSQRFHLHSVASRQTPAAPKLTITSPAGPEAISIHWEHTNKNKLPIDGFYVYYRSTSTAGDYLKATVEGAGTRGFTIKHLQPDTAYDLKLQAFTVNAASEFSEILTQKTERCSTVSPPPTPPTTTDINTELEPTSSSWRQLYITLGAALGGLALLLLLCLGIFCCGKHRQPSSASQDGDKTRHIQLEQLNVKPSSHANHNHGGYTGHGNHSNHGNNHVALANGHAGKANGYKMNITSNPLADTDEDKNQNVMEISFITRTSTTTTTTTTNNPNNNHLETNNAGNKREESNQSEDRTSSSASSLAGSCGMADSWRRCELNANFHNYV